MTESVYVDEGPDNEDWIKFGDPHGDTLEALWGDTDQLWTEARAVVQEPRTRVGAREWRVSRRHASTMVALLPRDGTWCRQDDPHVTVVFAGELAPDSAEVQRLLDWCRTAAAVTPRLEVPVTGLEVFGDGDDRVDVLTLGLTPELSALRDGVAWSDASAYPDYRPHATVGPEGSAAEVEVPSRLVLDRLWLVTGEDEWTWLLGGEVRTAGLGGQFAKGGGRVPGRTVPHGEDANPFKEVVVDGVMSVVKEQVEVPTDPSRVDLDRGDFRDAVEALSNDRDSEELRRAQESVTNFEGTFADLTVAAARHEYIGRNYGPINEAARSGGGTAAERKVVDDLDRAFTPPPARPLPEGRSVYRGVDFDTFGPTLRTGETFVDRGFVSTTELGSMAQTFSGPPTGGGSDARTIYRITPTATTAGTPCIPGNHTEAEWILPRGSVFTVERVQQYVTLAGGVRRIIDLTWDGVEA